MDTMRAMITGATSGIGRETAFQMAAAGASLVLAVRDVASGKTVADEIARKTGRAPPLVVSCDVSRPESVRACAAEVRGHVPHLDVLVNNAGIRKITRDETTAGVESVFDTNVLGYHRVTHELLPLLEAAPRARIVNVASTFAGGLDFEDLEFRRRPWSDEAAYKQSKQANRLWTWALARRLKGKRVTANAMSPGLVDTKLFREMKGFQRTVMSGLAMLFGRSVAKGADTVSWLALSADVDGQSDTFWVDRKKTRCSFRNEADEERMWSICDDYARRAPASA
jgi:NAD(P)-dependent dehydrogenase (short-subunit alcohol dehydrogenase family)